LDWQRHRLLFWDDQPSFNHNERPDYRDGCLYSESDTNTDPNPNPDPNPDSNPDTNPDTNSN
jgi:hypothetical protein